MIVCPWQRSNFSLRFIGKFGLILLAAAFFLLFLKTLDVRANVTGVLADTVAGIINDMSKKG